MAGVRATFQPFIVDDTNGILGKERDSNAYEVVTSKNIGKDLLNIQDTKEAHRFHVIVDNEKDG